MKTSTKSLLVVLFLSVLLVLSGLQLIRLASAQTGPSLPWTVMSGGGMGAANGDVVIRSTLGQPITGAAENGSTAAASGFWQAFGQALVSFYLPLLVR